MLDVKKNQKLVEMMVANDLVEISLRDGEEEINLRRPSVTSGGCSPEILTQPAALAPIPSAAPIPVSKQDATSEKDSQLEEITSPMVGTFYSKPDPESATFVKIGQQVQAGTVVCILEAMKVFNEIKSEISGTIEQIVVKDGEPVEFGQPLFLVHPQ